MAEIDMPVDVTIVMFGTRKPDGSVVVHYHGAIDGKVEALMRAVAGPVLVEHVLSAEDVAAFPVAGVMLVTPEASDG